MKKQAIVPMVVMASTVIIQPAASMVEEHRDQQGLDTPVVEHMAEQPGGGQGINQNNVIPPAPEQRPPKPPRECPEGMDKATWCRQWREYAGARLGRRPGDPLDIIAGMLARRDDTCSDSDGSDEVAAEILVRRDGVRLSSDDSDEEEDGDW
ncbi:MAG: hypothetical protein LBJ69_00715 [Holosporales bacterium]|jgi:hypothetical protein|nr:hypothetical protein [Holosporales bacterium]